MSYQDWLEENTITMSYECLIELPDGSCVQVRRQVKVADDKMADELIAEWNRLAKITKTIKYQYRRLS